MDTRSDTYCSLCGHSFSKGYSIKNVRGREGEPPPLGNLTPRPLFFLVSSADLRPTHPLFFSGWGGGLPPPTFFNGIALSTKSCLSWSHCHSHIGNNLMNREGAAHKPIGTTAVWCLGERLMLDMSLGKCWGGKTCYTFHVE